MNWILLAVLSAIFLGAYNFFLKVSSGHIDQIVGALILQVAAAVVGCVIFVILYFTHGPLAITQKGVMFAIIAGVMVGLSEITSFFLFAKGIPASVGIPIIVGGSILVGAVLGIIFFKESLTLLHYVAMSLIITGVVLLTATK